MLRREAYGHSTASHSNHELYQFTRMPLGLCNAPASFQRDIDIFLSSVRFKCVMMYVDDIIVFSKNDDEHFNNLENLCH